MKFERKRYIAFINFGNLNSEQNFFLLRQKFSELFGSLSLEEASLAMVFKKQNIFLVRVNLRFEKQLLFASCYLPLFSIFTTSSVKKAKEKIDHFEK
jgi:RNase P/RNase MRP subunit POP5